jgi:hypothetical protein
MKTPTRKKETLSVDGFSAERRALRTVGHATRSIAGFVDVLRGSDVTGLVDVHSFPRSRTNPQWR